MPSMGHLYGWSLAVFRAKSENDDKSNKELESFKLVLLMTGCDNINACANHQTYLKLPSLHLDLPRCRSLHKGLLPPWIVRVVKPLRN